MSFSKDEQRRVLAAEVFSRCYLVGEFTLRSGRTANRYFDKYQFESDPELLAALAAEMVPLVPDDVELLAGLEMGGVPVVTALAAATGIPAVFVRKNAKEYGTARLAEGPSVAGKKVLIVEDVVTSGGQIRLSASDLRDLGASVVGAICVIDREEGGPEILAEDGILLSSLFGAAELEAAAATDRPSPG